MGRIEFAVERVDGRLGGFGGIDDFVEALVRVYWGGRLNKQTVSLRVWVFWCFGLLEAEKVCWRQRWVFLAFLLVRAWMR